MFVGLLQTGSSSDTCGYVGTGDEQHDKCGDLCVFWQFDCKCGGEQFNVMHAKKHCCIQENVTCTKEENDKGKIIDILLFCHTAPVSELKEIYCAEKYAVVKEEGSPNHFFEDKNKKQKDNNKNKSNEVVDSLDPMM